MALAETANLIVTLGLKGNFARDMGRATDSLDTFTRGQSRAFTAGAQIGTGIKNAGRIAAVGIAAVVSQVALGLDSLIKLEKATAQTQAVIASTGGAAGVTAKDIRTLAEKYEALNATVGDEFVQAGANMLLTFTKVTGKGFEPALAAILDMNTALGKGPEGLTNTALQVGKALQDPTKGMLALRRAGVSFTDSQVQKIKSLQKEGKLYEAQQIIIAELNKEFGGSFLAQGGTTAGKVAKFTDSIEDLQRSLATALLPAVSNLADSLSEFFADPAVIKGAEDLGVEIGKLFSKDNIKAGIDALRGAFNTAREVAPIVAAAAKTMAGFISTAVGAFKSLPPEIQNLAIAGFAVNKLTGGLVTNIGGGLISAVLRQIKSAVVTVHGGVVNVSGPGTGGVPGAVGTGGGVVAGALKLIPAAIIASTIVAAAVPIGQAFAAALPKELKGPDGLGRSESQTRITAALELIAARLPKNVVAPKPSGEHEGAGFRPSPAGTNPFFKPDLLKPAVTAANQTTTAVETMRGNIGTSLSNVKTAVASAGIASALAAKNAGTETKGAVVAGAAVTGAMLGMQTATTRTSAYQTQGAVRGGSASIVGAIRANRPIITVNVSATTVSRTVNVTNRYGSPSGSRNMDRNDG